MARPLDQHWHGAFRDWVTPTRGRHAPASSYHTRSVTVTAATFWVIVSAATPPGRIGNWGLQTHEAITTPRQLNRAIEQNEASRCSNEHRSEEHTSELQSQSNLVCRLLLEKKKKKNKLTPPLQLPSHP